MTDRLSHFSSEGLTFDVHDDGPLDGPVVVALHGFPQAAGCWAEVTPHLVAAGFRVLAPDQRGYSPGARPQDVRSYAMASLTGDVLALADAAGADRFHVLGHDWGAGVAWTLAGRHADRVASLSALSVPHPGALVRSLVGTQVLRSWYMAFFQVPALPELLLGAGGGRLARWALAASGMRDVEPAVRLLADRRAARGIINWYRALRLPDQVSAGRTRVPTLYAWSDGDVALGRRGAEGTRDFVDGPYRFEVLDGASHWLPEERADDVAALVLEHLAQHPITA